MATLQDVVSPRLILTPGKAQEQQQPPIFGKVIAAGPPDTVLWPNWTTSLIIADIVDIIGEASSITKNKFIGKVVRRVITGAGATKPSAQFTGIVVGVYRRTPDNGVADPTLGPEYCLAKTLDAQPTYFEDLATVFEVVPGR